MKNKKTGDKWVNFAVILLSCVSVFVIGAFAVYNYLISREQFYNGTTINGINVGGLNIAEATNVVGTSFDSGLKDISVVLKHNEEEWEYTYKDFEVIDDFSPLIENAYNEITSNNVLERRFKYKEHKKNNGQIKISYRHMLGGFSEKLDFVSNEIYQELKEPKVEFNPNQKNPFTYLSGQAEITVDRQALESLIDNSFFTSKNIVIEVPVIVTEPEETAESLQEKTRLRSEFSTNYSSSSNNRKNNVKTALNAFNGKIVMPDEEVSFNQTTLPI